MGVEAEICPIQIEYQKRSVEEPQWENEQTAVKAWPENKILR